MDSRFQNLQRQIRDFGTWTATTIRAWAIFDANGLPLFLESEDPSLDDLEIALGAVASRLDEIIRASESFGIGIKTAALELKNRDKLHYFRMGDNSLVIITAFNIRGEEKFLENVAKYINLLQQNI